VDPLGLVPFVLSSSIPQNQGQVKDRCPLGEERAAQKIGQSAIGPLGWLEKGPTASLVVRYVSHPDPFEANGMPPTYEAMH
jgi:hypothetical protein